MTRNNNADRWAAGASEPQHGSPQRSECLEPTQTETTAPAQQVHTWLAIYSSGDGRREQTLPVREGRVPPTEITMPSGDVLRWRGSIRPRAGESLDAAIVRELHSLDDLVAQIEAEMAMEMAHRSGGATRAVA